VYLQILHNTIDKFIVARDKQEITTSIEKVIWIERHRILRF